jgi:hypothetical protein
MGNALYGLQGLGLVGEIGETSLFIETLFTQLEVLAGQTSQFQTVSSFDLITLSRKLGQTLPELRDTLNNNCKKWDQINLVLTNELALRRSKNDPILRPGNFQSNLERNFYTIVREVFENTPAILLKLSKQLQRND